MPNILTIKGWFRENKIKFSFFTWSTYLYFIMSYFLSYLKAQNDLSLRFFANLTLPKAPSPNSFNNS